MLTLEQSTLVMAGAKLLGIELIEAQLSEFAIYLEELNRWSKIADLVSQSETEIIIRKHILDSLAALTVLPKTGRLLDLGSGAGFPGLPIAIAIPTLSVTLLEPRRKRVNFLREVIRKTQLTNAQSYEGRAEEFTRMGGWQSAFDVIITRATWNLREFLAIGSLFVKHGGILVAMKGTRVREELQSFLTDESTGEFVLGEKIEYQLPYGKEERTILTFTKKVSRNT